MKLPYRFQYHKTDLAPEHASIGVTISKIKEPDVCAECENVIVPGAEYLLPKYFDTSGEGFLHAPVVCMPCAIAKGWVTHDGLG